MPIYSLQELRATAPEHLRNAPDSTLLREYAKSTGGDPVEAARYFGYGQDGGLASNRIGAGIDNYQANLYGLGEAVAGAAGFDGASKALGRRRQDNEFQANVSSQRAKELGGIDDFRDVDGIGSAANYVGGLAAQSLPYLGEAFVGGLAARGLMTGTRAALRGAQSVEAANAARKTLNLGSTAAAAAASYPSAVGDILSNQRDENGTTDLGSAALGGVPYAALNAVGVEGVVARGLRPLSQGGGDLLKRVGVTAGTTALSEGASETGQELINQYAGRMAVNPEQTLFNDEANKRYLDSFVGGAALGGVFGGAAGVRRPMEDGDLLKPDAPAQPPAPPPAPPQQIGYDGRAGEIITFADGSSELRSVLEARGEIERRPIDPAVQTELDAKAEAERLAAQKEQEIIAEVEKSKADALAKQQAEQQLVAERTARAKKFGVDLKGKVQLETFGLLQDALDANTIDTKTFANNLGLLAANKHGEVKKNLEAAALMRQLVELRSTGMPEAMFLEAEQEIRDGKLKSAQKFIDGWNTNAPVTTAPTGPAGTPAAAQPAATKAATPNAVAAPPAAANQPGATGGQPVRAASVPAVQQPVAESSGALSTETAGATVTVGRTGREQTLTKSQLAAKMAAATPIDQQRILDAMGLERDQDPTTGAPVYLPVADPRTFDQVAKLESARTGKKVTKQAIQQALKKFGITEGTITEAVGTSADTVSEAELGIDTTTDGSGFRTETQLSKATGQGLVDDGNTQTKAQREASAQADALLKEADPSTAVAVAEDAPPTNLPEGATVTDLREKNPETQANNIQAILSHAYAESAALYWDHDTVSWDDLPPTLKAEWVEDYVDNIRNNEGELNEKTIAQSEQRIGDDYRRFFGDQSVRQVGTSAPAAAVSDKPGVRSSAGGAQSRTAAKANATDVTPKVDPAKAAWDALRADVPQMPAFESLGERQQKQVADLVSREQFNLAAANTVVSPTPAPKPAPVVEAAPAPEAKPAVVVTKKRKVVAPEPIVEPAPEPVVEATPAPDAAPEPVVEAAPEPETTEEQRQVAENLAKDVGGTVVWQRGDLALLRGYSILNGQPVYAAAKGGSRTRVDIESFTGSLLNSAEKAELVTEKKKLEAQDSAQHQADPFVSFDSGNVQVSQSVSPKIAGIVSGWAKLLGLKVNIYVTTIEDAKANRSNFTGPHRAVGSAGLDANEAGSMRRLPDGSYYVAFTQSTSMTKMLEVLAHELGHVHEREAFNNADAETKQALRAAHAKWVSEQKGATAATLVGNLRAKTTARNTRTPKNAMASEMSSYWTSFSEWYADQVSRWAVSSDKPVGVVQQFFSRLGKTMQQFYFSLKGQKYLPDQTMKQFLDRVADSVVLDEPGAGPNVALNRDVMESKGKRTTKGSTVADVTAQAQAFMRVGTLGRSVFVVDKLDDLPPNVQRSSLNGATQGVAVFDGQGGRQVYLIASQIAPGKVKSVFLHEVGAHIGLEQLLSASEFKALTDQLIKWARAYQAGSDVLEHRLASLALERTEIAGVPQAERRSELLAYFIEEAVDAGIDPTASKLPDGPLRAWFRQVMQVFNKALTKLGVKPEALTAQDLVDMAYGAASLEVRNGAPPASAASGAARVQPSQAAPSSGIPSIDRAPELVSNLFESFKDKASWVGVRTMFTEDLIALAAKVIPSARDYKSAMDRIEVARGRMERDVVKILQDFRTLPAHEQAKGPASVNGLLMDSTMQREWAFQPDWVSAPVTINPALKGRFDAMSAGGQALVKRVFKHGHDTLQQMQAAVQNNVASEYDAAIAEATAAGNKAQATKLTTKKTKEIADFKSMLDMRSTWPYAPLKRFGKHVVMGYSAEYAAAKATNDKTTMQRLQKDGDHYYVGFAETKAQARAMLAEIAPTFDGGKSGTFEKLDGAEEFMGGRDMMGAFQRLRTLVADQKDDADPKTAGRIDNMMRQMHLTLLSETSARKSEIHRRNVAGADGDMMRAFATQGRATAHFVAGLQTNGKVNELLRTMKNDASRTLGDREQKQAYFNEIMRRHSMNLEFAPAGVIEKAMAGTSVWMLLTNPSYFLVNMTQPLMMSSPLMGARFGYARAHAEMFRAYREVAPILKNAKFTEDDYSTLPKDTRQAIEELANMGVIDISLESVLGQFESATGSVASKLDPVMQRMRGAAQGVEALNRITTAMAAYRMAKVDGGHDAAVKYAAQVIYETHGDYSGFNAPRFMRRGVGKLATQFRKFQLIQLSMFARLLNTAFKGASTEERFIAKKALAFNLAHLGAAGGLMGMPAFTMIAWVIGKAIPGDDEPDDPEATLRRLIGDKALADLLLKGAPKLLGVDISGRVGAGGMLSLLPYTDLEMSRDGYANAVVGLLGPFVGGLAPKVVDGVGQIAQGNLWKGTEQLLPTGLANVMKATRFTTDGLTKRNGDVVLSADEVGFLDAMAQAVGLPTNVTTDRQFLASAQFTSDKFYRERTTQLKNQYSAAVRKNDTDAMRDVREEWMQTQAARRKLGFEVQPLSTLLKAPQEQRKREASTQAGVQTTKSNAGFLVPLQ